MRQLIHMLASVARAKIHWRRSSL